MARSGVIWDQKTQSDEALVPDPSNAGVADPGYSIAIAFCQVIAVLLATKPNFEALVITKILPELVREIGEAFLRARENRDV